MNTQTNQVRTEDRGTYNVTTETKLQAKVDKLLNEVREHLRNKNLHTHNEFTSPGLVRDYLSLTLALEEREHFHVLYLNNRIQLLEDCRLFSGTIDSASVYPREVLKKALQVNAAAVILAHNHPSGLAEPSRADIKITEQIKQALELVDIRTLDHLIIGSEEVYSFAEHGRLVG